MAGNIKGLNIEIGGTTTKLVDALKKPVTETQKLKSELKSVNSALKFDSKNVDLLDQKQRLLTKTIESTEDELKLLKEAQKQYIESGKDIDGAEYVVLENKIALCEHSLENLKNQQNNFSGSLQAMGMKATEFGDKTEALGKKFLPVTAGITAVGTAAGAAWNEIDQAYDTIAAGTGATGEALEELKGNFENVFGNFPASAEDTSTALADINTRFGLTDDALEKATEQFLQFSRVNGTDVSGSIENVAKAMYDAGIPTEELGSVLDELTAVSQASGMTVDDLASKLSENGVNMRELGFDTSETLAMLATFEKNGVNTSTVLTGMKTAVKNCAKEGKDGKAEMEAFFKKVEDGSVTAQDAIELFGAKSGAAIFQYAQEGKLNFEDLMQVAADSGGQLEASFEEMIDPADKAQLAVNNLKLAGAELFQTIQEVAAPIIEKLVKKCQDLVNWFKNLSDGQKELIVKLGALAAAIGPVLIGVGKLSKGFGSVIDYFGKTTTAGGKVVASLKGLAGASSIGVGAFAAIVAAVAAVVGAFVHLWNTNEDFRNKMTEIWDGLKQKFQDFAQGIVDRLNSLGFSFKDITEVISTVWNGFCDLLAPVFEAAWQVISTVLGTILDVLTGILDVFIGLFTGNWDQFLQGIQEIFEGIWNGIKEFFQTIWDMIKGILDTVLGWFGTDWETFWNDIKTFFENIWNGIKTFFENIWNNIKSFAEGIWNGIKSLFENVWNGIKSFFENTLNGIKSFAEGIWNGMKSTCQTVWNGIKTAIVDPITTAYNKVKEIFQGIHDWISDKINAAKDTVGSAIDKIKGFFNFEFKWPHIPMPHFSVSGSANPLDWLSGGLPHFSVEWYRKAMDGLIMNSPTIFGLNASGQLMGGGEAGAEAVVGVASLREMIYGAVAQATAAQLDAARMVAASGQAEVLEIDYDRLGNIVIDGIKNLKIEGHAYLDKSKTGTLLADVIDQRLQKAANKR